MNRFKYKTISAALFVSTLLAGCITVNSGPPRPEKRVAPSAWGMLSNSNGCVIFREYGKTTVGFFVVAATAKTESYLEVVESTGYDMKTSIWPETQESMNELQKLAVENLLRFVKIQDGYPASELETARTICRQDSVLGPSS